MKTNVTKPKKTAEQAAMEVLEAAKAKKLHAAERKLTEFVKSWEVETGCTFIVRTEVLGDRAQSRLQIILKP